MKKNGTMEVVKVLAGAGPDGKKYLCILNRGPAVALDGITVDGKPIPSGAIKQGIATAIGLIKLIYNLARYEQMVRLKLLPRTAA